MDDFDSVFKENYPKILNYILRRTADIEVAHDLTSEVFMKAFLKRSFFEWRRIPISAWLYKIALNEIRMFYRRGRRTHSLEQFMEAGFEPADPQHFIDELEEAQRVLEQHQAFLQVQKELERLPMKYQEVISLRFFEEKSLAEIAEILGKREGTIKSLLSRGLVKLRAVQPLLIARIEEDEASLFYPLKPEING